MTTTPADNPCPCRACGTLILASVTDMCEDCVTETNRYYDERDASERVDSIREAYIPDNPPEINH